MLTLEVEPDNSRLFDVLCPSVHRQMSVFEDEETALETLKGKLLRPTTEQFKAPLNQLGDTKNNTI